MQGVEMCKDRPHERAAKPHKPLLKLCCFQSSCSVPSLFMAGPPAPHAAAGMAGACYAPHLLQPIPHMHCPSAMHCAPTNSQGCAEHALKLGDEQDGDEPQLSCLLPVTEGGRRAIWKTSEYCRLVDLMKNVIFIQMADLKSMN